MLAELPIPGPLHAAAGGRMAGGASTRDGTGAGFAASSSPEGPGGQPEPGSRSITRGGQHFEPAERGQLSTGVDSLLGQDGEPLPQPRRRSSAQLRDPHDRPLALAASLRDARLHRAPERRRQDEARSAAGAQTPSLETFVQTARRDDLTLWKHPPRTARHSGPQSATGGMNGLPPLAPGPSTPGRPMTRAP